MAYNNPNVADFVLYFQRDFPFGTDPDTSVLDTDITKAFQMANMNINQALFADQGSYTVGYLLLSAHYMVTNLRASSQGINGQYNFLQQSKGAGQVNEAFSIPQRILDDPYFSMLCKTNYGAEYIMLLLPQLAGTVSVAYGSTRP